MYVNSFINSGDSIGPIAKYCDLVNSGEGEALIWFLKENNNNLQVLLDKSEKSEGKACYIPAEKVCDKKILCQDTFIAVLGHTEPITAGWTLGYFVELRGIL